MKNVVTLQQEKLLDERGTTVDNLQKEIGGLKETVTKKTDNINELHKRVEDLQHKLDESKCIIEDNNHGLSNRQIIFNYKHFLVIEWLHKQLNEDALHRGFSNTLPTNTGGYGPIDFDKYANEKVRKP